MLCTFQVFLGAQAGMTLLIFNDWKSRIVRCLLCWLDLPPLALFALYSAWHPTLKKNLSKK